MAMLHRHVPQDTTGRRMRCEWIHVLGIVIGHVRSRAIGSVMAMNVYLMWLDGEFKESPLPAYRAWFGRIRSNRKWSIGKFLRHENRA
jgi:hypothetical protein